MKFCEILTCPTCEQHEVESTSHLFLTALCVNAVHCVSGSRYNYFRHLLDHPRAGGEPRRPGTKTRNGKKSEYDRQRVHNPISIKAINMQLKFHGTKWHFPVRRVTKL